MPIFVQCVNGHPLQVESSLAGKRIRCKKCGDTILVPTGAEPNVSPESRDRQGSRPESGVLSDSDARASRMTQPIRGELIPADVPELKMPGSKSRGHGRGTSSREQRRWDRNDDQEHENGETHWTARPRDFDRGDIESVDFLFENHPRPVGRRYSIPISVTILLMPLLIYLGLRYAVDSIPKEYLANVKRMAVQRANHDGTSTIDPLGLAENADDSDQQLAPELDEQKMLIRAVCLGGNGRYLVTHHAPIRHRSSGGYVRVQDLQQRETIGTIAIEGPQVSIAAGMDTLVVGDWGSASLEAFRLPSLQRIQRRLVPPDAAPISLAMGHASYGPLYVINSQSQLEIRELSTLARISLGEDISDARLLFDKRSLCNASADGTVFCGQGSHLNIVHYSLGRFRGEGQSTVFASDHVAPTLSFDGKRIFTPQGVYASSLAMFDLKHRSCLAAATGPFFVGPSARTQSELNKLWLYVADHDEPIAEIPQAIASPLAVARNAFAAQTLTNDKRLILIPSQKCIVTIEPESDETVVHDFDFDEVAGRKGISVPRVTSLPPPRVTRGELFQYPVQVTGFQQPLYRLNLAPPGMQIDPEGTIAWDCDQREGFVHPVVLSVRDGATGSQAAATQSFHVTVGGPLISPLSLRSDGATPLHQPSRTRDMPPSIDVASGQRSTDASAIHRIDLPGIVRQPTMAGEGRFLIARLVEVDSLAIIDLLEPDSVRYLPIEPTCVFAASKSSIVVCDLAKSSLERFDLMQLRSSAKAPFPSRKQSTDPILVPDSLTGTMTRSGQPESVARMLMRHGEISTSPVHHVRMSMGCEQNGPLLYCDHNEGFFIDPNTLQRIGLVSSDPESTSLLASRWRFTMQPDGKSFVGAYDYESPSELRGGMFDGTTVTYHTPTPFNSATGQSREGIVFVDDPVQTIVTKQVVMGIGAGRAKHLAVPSLDRFGYVAVQMQEGPLSRHPTTDVFRYDDDEFHKPSERRKLVTIPRQDLEPPLTERREYRGFLPWEQRIIHIPQLNLLVTIPAVGNRVVVIPLEKSAAQYASAVTASQTEITPLSPIESPALANHGANP
tara:strand:- start:509408 stop:512611 length:3204 start_codon:yes stop_codon:yes gene_type:complete